MEEACEIARLPEELLSAALARTSPRNAFRAAAGSDDVWASFLPPGGLPPLADGELAPAPPSSKKELFLRLSAGVLLQDRLVSMWLDREAGSKCYVLSAWDVEAIWSGDSDYPRRVPCEDSRLFTEL
ncbi:F-box protein PP2-B11-like isoform X2 [Triticum dicoccoides]|uniref:F-box protein PP2-B11-like isoform X2 n=1 Tax=Triticum dicoccoides TaxID=85692 RepID=UPI001890FC10|nr:F-box protein PP2-B11-like isoform X2 [Triticum dicoccoides]